MDRLLAALAAAGLSVAPGGPGQLVLRGPKEAKTPELLAGLAMFKPDLLARFNPGTPAEPSPVKPEPPGGEQ